jgi:uncharacterized protein (TIRG00374 family)
MSDRPNLSRLKWLLRLVASGVLITWIVSRAELDAILEAASHANPLWLILAAIVPVLATFIVVGRWWELLAAGGVRLSRHLLFASSLVSAMARQFLPTTIGGDVIRAYDTWRAGAKRQLAISSLFTERVVGGFALSLVAAVAALLPNEVSREVPWLFLWFIALSLGLGGLCWLLFAHPHAWVTGMAARVASGEGRLARLTTKLVSAVFIYQGKGRLFARVLAWSFLMQVTMIAFYWLVARSLGLPVDFLDLCVIVPIAVLVMMIPISLNGIGLREGSFVLLLGLYGVEASVAVAFAWIEYAISLAHAGLGGIAYVVRRDPAAQRGTSLASAAEWAEGAPVSDSSEPGPTSTAP